MRLRPIVLPVAAVLVVLPRLAAAQTAADLFDASVMQEVRLSVNSRDLAQLRAHTELNTHYPADLSWRNVKVRNVSIRSRGQGSRNPVKPGYRVEVDRYTTGQTFAGLSALVLDNIWQDDSLIREKLAFEMFEKMGLPAPRESFCRLYINNEYQGVYNITEEIDGKFAQRVTGESDGTVFEYHWSADGIWRAEDLGSIAAYKPKLEPRTHVLDADSTLYTPIVDLFHEVSGPDDAVWRSRVEQYVDLPQFVTHVAIEMYIAENDGILGYAGMNNFYLYRDQGTTRHRLFVWDKDNAFLFIDSPIRTTDDNVLFRRAMAYPDLRETFLAALERCAQIARTDDFLALEIDRLAGLIYDAATSDPKKQFDNQRWGDAVAFLRDFAARRPQIVLDQVAQLRKSGA
jgi:spore coat protein CotH